METVLKAIADWIKGILTAGIMSNLSGLFDDVNTQVGNIAQQVGTKPSAFEPRVFAIPMQSCWLPARKILNPATAKRFAAVSLPVIMMRLSSDTASLKRFPCPQNDRSV